jgi:hypothetical protein
VCPVGAVFTLERVGEDFPVAHPEFEGMKLRAIRWGSEKNSRSAEMTNGKDHFFVNVGTSQHASPATTGASALSNNFGGWSARWGRQRSGTAFTDVEIYLGPLKGFKLKSASC